MDIREAQRQQKEAQEWAACDPITLVAAAKETLYGEVKPQHQGGNSTALKPLEEVISRFEQQTRAGAGAGFVLTGSQQRP